MNTNDDVSSLIRARIDIGILQTQMAELRMGQAGMAQQLRDIQATLSEAKGGWKALMILGGAGAAFGSAIAYILQHFPFRG